MLQRRITEIDQKKEELKIEVRMRCVSHRNILITSEKNYILVQNVSQTFRNHIIKANVSNLHYLFT